MLFKKAPPAPAHFRRFVEAKDSWPLVWERLEFTPEIRDPSARRQSVDAATRAGIERAFRLLTVTHFAIVSSVDRRLVSTVGEEALLLEGLAFAASAVCNSINPDSDSYDTCLVARQAVTDAFACMSLLNGDLIEDTALSRFDLYDEAGAAPDHQRYLGDTHARVLTYLANGESPLRIEVRYQDPAAIPFRVATEQFLSVVDTRLNEIFSRIVKREMDEEENW